MSTDKEINVEEIDLDKVVIQEPKKNRGAVGDRVWGPYKRHAGSESSAKYAGGPWGLGDPDDESLRISEREILIPNMIRKKVNATWCKEQNEAFFNCAVENGMTKMTWKCRPQAKLLRECGLKAMNDPDKIAEVTRDYLDMRAEYRRTGKRKLLKRM